MPDPAGLPAELFEIIIDYAGGGRNDIQLFYNSCLVNRKWHTKLAPRLYYKWTYDGVAHSLISLWNFLQTMLHSTQIAECVRVLDIGYWGFRSSLYSDYEVMFPDEELAVVHEAVVEAGMLGLESKIMEAIQSNDRRPVMALLLTVLPNLTTITAHIPEKDPYLAEVLKLSLEDKENRPCRQAFQKLERAQIMSEWHEPHPIFREPRDNFLLSLEYLWPMFRLPSLKELSVFGFEPKDASVHFKDCAKTSSITHLTLVNHIDSCISAHDAQALIALPKALVSLTMYLKDCFIFEKPQIKQISNDALWSALQPHWESIEHIDFYRDYNRVPPSMRGQGNSHFGSLRFFKRLSSLYIQPETLFGGLSRDPVALFRLNDTLPSTLRDLVFYGNEGMLRNTDLSGQICEFLEGSDSISLNSIVLEDVLHLEESSSSAIQLLYQEVEMACRKRLIRYQKLRDRGRAMSVLAEGGKVLPKGGLKLPCFRNISKTQVRKQKKWRQDQEIKFAEMRREARRVEWEKRRIRRLLPKESVSQN